MKKWRISRLYIQIVASFLCIVLFAGAILAFVSVWFSQKNRADFLEKAQSILDMNDRQMIENLEYLYSASGSLLTNQVVKDHLRVYSALSPENRYYYQSIVDLLVQAYFQFGGLVDSIFLYTDDQHVLYGGKENGMTMFDTFFSSLMRYNHYDAEYWKEILDESGRSYSILPPDKYASYFANDEHTVVPLVYHVPGVTGTNVLVTNLSCENLLKQYELSSLSSQTRMGIYALDGSLIVGDASFPEDCLALQSGHTVHVDGEDCFVFTLKQSMLNLYICAFVPVSALIDVTAYYRFSIILLLAVFVAFSTMITIVMSRRAYAPVLQVHRSISNISDVEPVSSLSNELEVIQSTISKLVDEREFYCTQNHQHSQHYIAQGFAALLDGRILEDGMYFSSLLSNKYGFGMRWFRCADVLVDVNNESGYMSRVELMEEVRNRIHAAFEGDSPIFSILYQSNMLVLLIDSDNISEREISDKLNNVSESLVSWCGLRIGLGEPVNQLSLLSRSFEQANSAIFAFPHSASNDTFAYDRSEVLNAANTHDIKRIEDTAYGILNRAKRAALSYADAVDIIRDIRETVISAQYRFGMQTLPCDDGAEINPLEILLLSPEINITPLIAALLPYVPYQTPVQEKSADKIVNKLCAFIDEHFSEELSLDILADKMGISGKYLSRIFKQAMNVNLSDYLAFVRVEKAKELLMTDMPLNQIMEEVGIFNRTTFTRMFRRLEGVTPSEYRNLYKE